MKKLLVIDDSLTIKKALEIAFAHEDYHLMYCNNGDDVMTMVKEVIPHAILVDIRMSGKDGYEICKIIKDEERLGKLPVILFGAEEFFEEAKAKVCNYDGFIPKPFGTEEIIKSLEIIIKRNQKLFPEIQELSDRSGLRIPEVSTGTEASAFAMPHGEASVQSLDENVVHQIETQTRESAVEFKELFENQESPVREESVPDVNQTSESTPEEVPAESSPEGSPVESREQYQEAAPVENAESEEASESMSYEDDTQDLVRQNKEEVPEESVEETYSLSKEEAKEEANAEEAQEAENIEYESVPEETEGKQFEDNEDIVQEIDKVTDEEDEPDDVQISSIADKEQETPFAPMLQGPPHLDLEKKLIDSLEQQIKIFISSLDREAIIAHIKKTIHDSIETLCKDAVPQIAERQIKEKIDELLKEKK